MSPSSQASPPWRAASGTASGTASSSTASSCPPFQQSISFNQRLTEVKSPVNRPPTPNRLSWARTNQPLPRVHPRAPRSPASTQETRVSPASTQVVRVHPVVPAWSLPKGTQGSLRKPKCTLAGAGEGRSPAFPRSARGQTTLRGARRLESPPGTPPKRFPALSLASFSFSTPYKRLAIIGDRIILTVIWSSLFPVVSCSTSVPRRAFGLPWASAGGRGRARGMG